LNPEVKVPAPSPLSLPLPLPSHLTRCAQLACVPVIAPGGSGGVDVTD